MAPFLFGDAMQIIYKDINELKPYEKNPRKNDKAVEAVARSIDEFGFKVPCVISADGTLITGHTRFKAAKKRGIEKIPCIVADDLSEEQIRAFRLADNKVSELAEWDFNKLDKELEEILNIDMEEFGFEFDFEEEDDGYYGDERERTYNEYNLDAFDEDETEGFYQMPVLMPCDHVPADIKSFNYMLSAREKDFGIHFYCDDYQFERIWNRPEFYIDKLREFQCAFTPDFSLYMDMPMAMKVWNVYRSRLIGQMMQREGLDVIPTVSWAEPDTFDFCFDGLPHDATLSISTTGVKESPEAMEVWTAGVDEMIKRLTPKRLLIYGGKVDYDYGAIEVIYYDNATIERMKKR